MTVILWNCTDSVYHHNRGEQLIQKAVDHILKPFIFIHNKTLFKFGKMENDNHLILAISLQLSGTYNK